MHPLVAEALSAVVVKQDGALSAIGDADLSRLREDFAATLEITAHLETLVAAEKLYRQGLQMVARQLLLLAEEGLPLAERLGTQLGAALRLAARTIDGKDQTAMSLQRPTSQGASLGRKTW